MIDWFNYRNITFIICLMVDFLVAKSIGFCSVWKIFGRNSFIVGLLLFTVVRIIFLLKKSRQKKRHLHDEKKTQLFLHHQHKTSPTILFHVPFFFVVVVVYIRSRSFFSKFYLDCSYKQTHTHTRISNCLIWWMSE